MEAIEQSNATTPGGILVDALPYIDHGYDEPGVREAVSDFNFLLLKSHEKIFCENTNNKNNRQIKNL